jgi:hypothetical protein
VSGLALCVAHQIVFGWRALHQSLMLHRRTPLIRSHPPAWACVTATHPHGHRTKVATQSHSNSNPSDLFLWVVAALRRYQMERSSVVWWLPSWSWRLLWSWRSL